MMLALTPSTRFNFRGTGSDEVMDLRRNQSRGGVKSSSRPSVSHSLGLISGIHLDSVVITCEANPQHYYEEYGSARTTEH